MSSGCSDVSRKRCETFHRRRVQAQVTSPRAPGVSGPYPAKYQPVPLPAAQNLIHPDQRVAVPVPYKALLFEKKSCLLYVIDLFVLVLRLVDRSSSFTDDVGCDVLVLHVTFVF